MSTNSPVSAAATEGADPQSFPARTLSASLTVKDLQIGQDNGAKGWDRVKGEGFSLQVTTDRNVDEIAKLLRASP